MKPETLPRRPAMRWTALAILPLLAVALYVASCASSSSSSSTTMAATTPATPAMAASPPSPDPRIGLRAGDRDAGVALWNLRMVSNSPPTEGFVGVTNSDLAFKGNYVIQGNYNGYQVWDITNAGRPTLKHAYLCPASQSDVSVYGNLIFVSGEGQSGRVDCGTQGVEDSVSTHRLRGIRVFDITDIGNPRYVANVQTCRGSHTHTVVSDPNDPANVYIYVSGASRVRSPSELPGCSDLMPDDDPNSSRFRIEVIRVPLANPEAARIVSSPRIFDGLGPAPRRTEPPRQGRGGRGDAAGGGRGAGGQRALRGGGGGGDPPTGPEQCHDITVYPAIGLAGGACRGYGLLLDIRDVANPRRLSAVADTNFSFWHSATFSNDGSKVLFTDEWGGGGAPRCRVTDRYEWGANALFTIDDNQMNFKSYYKMPAAQTELENCVAHNGSLIPIPGRDVMVQGWYQGGISIFDWTDPSRPFEIAFFDRGPFDPTRMVSAGSWSVYWYNGYLISSEIKRGLDILELTPSAFLSQNEIDAANTVRFDVLNAQEQPQIVWPPSFAIARAFVDQLERSRGLSTARITAVRSELAGAQRLAGQQRSSALTQLATQLDSDVRGSSDQAKLRMLTGAVRDLAGAR